MRKMSRNCVALWAVLGALYVCAAEENPFAKAKVGDWIEHTTTMEMPGNTMTTTMRKEVVKKTDTEITLEITTKMKDMDPIKQTVTIPLDLKAKKADAEQDIETKELSTGNETVKMAGKSLETKWVEAEVNNKKTNMKMKTKTWMSKDIPLDGVVKSVVEMPQGKTLMELKDFGFGK